MKGTAQEWRAGTFESCGCGCGRLQILEDLGLRDPKTRVWFFGPCYVVRGTRAVQAEAVPGKLSPATKEGAR